MSSKSLILSIVHCRNSPCTQVQYTLRLQRDYREITDQSLGEVLENEGHYIARHPPTQKVRVHSLGNAAKQRKEVVVIHFSDQTTLR